MAEILSHNPKTALTVMEAFVKAFKPEKILLVGGGGLDIEQFLSMDVKQWLP